jgi:hypothetical protein
VFLELLVADEVVVVAATEYLISGFMPNNAALLLQADVTELLVLNVLPPSIFSTTVGARPGIVATAW